MKLNGKVAVVTGASMGIGEAIAQLFVAEGATVVLLSRNQQRIEAARARLSRPDHAIAMECDVRRRGDLERALNLALDRLGRIDIWVNNAGHGLIDSVASMDVEACRSVFATNFFGALEAMQIVIPVMKRQGEGTIVNISSVVGYLATPYSAAYCATKHALNAISHAARIELRRTGIRVLTVCPGYIDTDFAANALKGREPMRLSLQARRGVTPQRVARAVLRGYLAGKREVVVPWSAYFYLGAYRFFPQLVEWAMERMLRPADAVIAAARADKSRG